MNTTDPFLIFGTLTPEAALLMLIKIMFVIGGLLYLVFSLVVIRQISIMKKTLITTLSPAIALLGYLHLALTLAVLWFFFFLI